MRRRGTLLLASLLAVVSITACSNPDAPNTNQTTTSVEASSTTTTTTQMVTTTTQATSATVIVQQGDTWWGIASAHGVSVDDLAAANDRTADDYIHPDEALIIPSTTQSDEAETTPSSVEIE